ncbi:dol-P-Man:Man(5)GlcNAc(2)-PP-Dol alpha-1,3-mannosyltransferase isoform X2 [Humulus lupulus]|uniref:dol-P-Man:Man(5)GlcNAc(2)-PP-Dol alpha-1,3-mannosyltransferase isoform X2 n=1 Tax=Humulus lupulus TaxID=3486 RepID=UPI002B40A164|nr:dol-P-Man:Man(5)GlcNAc(2)-PP-Dol alpha-1,3-mannosyltransferase isoform X2 [Humulus lupulus]
MADKSATQRHTSERMAANFFRNPNLIFPFALISADALLISLIIAYVPYTKIDWDAYMSQVIGFLGGERDYKNLKGDTGPLVYPAGFLYVYAAIRYVTGGEVYPAQILFGILYIINLGIILAIYLKTDVVASGVDHFQAMDITGVISALAGAALVQILLALPFIISYPFSYISRAFNLGRVFIHFWSVNFKFVPEQIFVSKSFAVSLLIAHLGLLIAFAHYRWCKHEGGLLNFLHSILVSIKLRLSRSTLKNSNNGHRSLKVLKAEHIVTTMFVGNFIGIICARSLHYQFYSWYFYSIPYLLWKTRYPTLLRVLLFVGTEFCWNVYPSNAYSSALLLCLHLVILFGLWSAPSEFPYVSNKKTE